MRFNSGVRLLVIEGEGVFGRHVSGLQQPPIQPLRPPFQLLQPGHPWTMVFRFATIQDTAEALERRSAVIRAAPAEQLLYTKATAPAGAVGMRPPADDFSVTAPQLRVVSASDTTTTASLSRTARASTVAASKELSSKLDKEAMRSLVQAQKNVLCLIV